MTFVTHPGDALSRRQRVVYVIILGSLTALGPFTIDLYLPAFPAVQREFSVSTAVIQLTLTATTLGFALGQLVVGPWSDRVGRRTPLLIATGLHIFASIGVAIAPNVELVAVLRLVQGIGAAGGGVVALAMVRDLFGGLPLVRMLSRLSLVSGLAPVIAPVVGSQLLRVLDWRGVFFFLAAYGLVAFGAAAVLLVETRPALRRGEVGHSTAAARYRVLLSDRVFVGVVLITGMTGTGLFTYLASSSFLFQDVYGFTAQQFGLLFAINSVGIIIGVQTSSRLVRVVRPQWILTGAVSGMFLSGLAIILLTSHHAGLFGVAIPLWFFITSCGFAFPMQQALALANHGAEAATAASIMGAVNFGLAGLLSPVAGLFGISNAIPMATVMTCAAAISLVVMTFVVRPRTVAALSR